MLAEEDQRSQQMRADEQQRQRQQAAAAEQRRRILHEIEQEQRENQIAMEMQEQRLQEERDRQIQLDEAAVQRCRPASAGRRAVSGGGLSRQNSNGSTETMMQLRAAEADAAIILDMMKYDWEDPDFEPVCVCVVSLMSCGAGFWSLWMLWLLCMSSCCCHSVNQFHFNQPSVQWFWCSIGSNG